MTPPEFNDANALESLFIEHLKTGEWSLFEAVDVSSTINSGLIFNLYSSISISHMCELLFIQHLKAGEW